MGLFGKPFEEKVKKAVAQIGAMGLGLKNLNASVSGKTVTLTGEAASLEVKTRAMVEFDNRIDAGNVVNQIRIAAGAAPKDAAPAAAPAPEFECREVQSGDTLSALARRFHGRGGMSMKIFEANNDVLTNPNLIKVGQKLRIPN